MRLCRDMFWYHGLFLGAKAYNINQLLGADVHIRNTVQPTARKSQLAAGGSWINFIWGDFGRGLTNHCCLQRSAWVLLPWCRAMGWRSWGAPSSLHARHCLLALSLQSSRRAASAMRGVTVSPLKPAAPRMAGCPAAFLPQGKAPRYHLAICFSSLLISNRGRLPAHCPASWRHPCPQQLPSKVWALLHLHGASVGLLLEKPIG